MAGNNPGPLGMDGTLPATLLHPLLGNLHQRNQRAIATLDREFPAFPATSLLVDGDTALPRADFARIYGRSAVLLAAAIGGAGQADVAADYTSRVDFMLTVLLSSRTLRDAVDNMDRFNAMLSDHGVSISGSRHDGYDIITVDLQHSLPGAPTCLLAVCIILIVNMFSWLTGGRIDICDIGLAAPADEQLDPCLALLGVPVRMGQPANCIRLTLGTFDRRVVGTAPRGQMLVLCHDPAWLRDWDRAFAARVSQAFTELAARNGRCPDRLAVCAFLEMSPSTLHRNLVGAGTSFQAEKIAWQTTAALTLIRRGDTMQSVATALGFQGARSFRRAFTGWTGQLPSSFRDEG